MFRAFLMTLMAAASPSAGAGWIEVGSNEGGAFYADPGSIIRTAGKRKMRTLHDFRSPARASGSTFLSVEAQEEFDCGAGKSRTLFFTSYSGNLGKGAKVATDPDVHAWEPAKPGSVRNSLLEFACQPK